MYNCDFMLNIGARFDDRVTGRLKDFSPNSQKIHVDIDPSSINKVVKVDLDFVSDANEFLKALLKEIKSDHFKKYKSQYIEYLNLNKSFKKSSINSLSNYFDEIFSLSETLFKSIIKLYKKDVNISNYAFSRIKTLSTLRFNYYPNQTKPVEISKQDGVALGCETHVDSGVFTVLYQDKKGGLQVQNRKNKKWYDVPFNKNALIVNTGLALEYLSKGKFKATNHRVLWNKEKRISIPFFFEPSYDFKMSHYFLNGGSKNKEKGIFFQNFLKNSLKKFIEYQR